MAVLVVLLLASRFAGAVRVVNTEIKDRCERLEGVYVDARGKIEGSVKGDGDVTDSKNVIRLLRAARSLKKALYSECEWATNLPKASHEADAPFLSEHVHSKLAQRPCGDQALAMVKAGKLHQAINTFMAAEGECPAMPQTTQTDGNPDVAEPEVPSVPDVKDVVNEFADAIIAKVANAEQQEADESDIGVVTPVEETSTEEEKDAEELDIDDDELAKEAKDDVEDSNADAEIVERATNTLESAERSLRALGSGEDIDDDKLVEEAEADVEDSGSGSGSSSALLEQTMWLALGRTAAVVVTVILFIFFPHFVFPALVVLGIMYLLHEL
eukprot:TRINITY_DN1984_c0_g1_i5.p1 TRINITY_DN1984_c0_g1~~TRINITY_DN1984_c0_g1_i5.p1  ORF type:complete len:328 (+),score=74.89 TRINITY_DN1984_c0_g1_i5:87-1070(+)